jgi:hypothetical protein
MNSWPKYTACTGGWGRLRPPGRLDKAITRAYTRHHEVGGPDDRGFYHGLLTGYAVAMKVLEGKLNRPAK